MRKAKIIFNKGELAATLTEIDRGIEYIVEYVDEYSGPPISLTMPIKQKIYRFSSFPSYFEGVLPEGFQLEYLLRLEKLDRDDYFGQLVCVGKDLVGAFTVEEEV
jgi:serine/threonine-protein kinase HipA